jgi:hypothetical protein
MDKTNKEAALVNIENPSALNIRTTITEEQRKYRDLVFEISPQWKQTKIIVNPFLLSATGVIPNMLNNILNTIHLLPRLLS